MLVLTMVFIRVCPFGWRNCQDIALQAGQPAGRMTPPAESRSPDACWRILPVGIATCDRGSCDTLRPVRRRLSWSAAIIDWVSGGGVWHSTYSCDTFVAVPW